MLRSMLLAACAAMVVGASAVWAQQATPPIMPKILELPLPPPVELPPPPEMPADVPNRPLTADEAVAVALRHQPSLVAARAGVMGAQGVVEQSRSYLKPKVSVSANGSKVSSNAGGGFGVGGSTTDSYVAAATARQLIYDFNHTRDLARQSVAQERSAQAVLTRTENDLALQVKQAFYTYLQNLRLVDTNQINVRNRLGHFALAQARLKAGLGLPSDVVTAQTAYAQAVYNLGVARDKAMTSRVVLAEILGIDPRTPIEVASVGEVGPGADDLNALTQEGLKRRPEMVQARAAIDAARFGVSAAQTTNSPTVFGSATFNNFGGQFPPTNRSLILSLGLSWTPVDSGLTAGAVKSAQANLQAAQANLETERLAVISDVSQAYLNVKSAEQTLQAAQAEVANGEEALRLAQGRYRAGVAIFIEVLDAETDLDTARINEVSSQAALDQARAALAHALGQAYVPATAPPPERPVPPPTTGTEEGPAPPVPPAPAVMPLMPGTPGAATGPEPPPAK